MATAIKKSAETLEKKKKEKKTAEIKNVNNLSQVR